MYQLISLLRTSELSPLAGCYEYLYTGVCAKKSFHFFGINVLVQLLAGMAVTCLVL